jgi:hypothetical protein
MTFFIYVLLKVRKITIVLFIGFFKRENEYEIIKNVLLDFFKNFAQDNDSITIT